MIQQRLKFWILTLNLFEYWIWIIPSSIYNWFLMKRLLRFFSSYWASNSAFFFSSSFFLTSFIFSKLTSGASWSLAISQVLSSFSSSSNLNFCFFFLRAFFLLACSSSHRAFYWSSQALYSSLFWIHWRNLLSLMARFLMTMVPRCRPLILNLDCI